MRNQRLTYNLFRLLFNENKEGLLRFAYSAVRDSEAARDIVSDTFLKMWEKRDSIEVPQFRQYLFSSVKNACLNYRRDSRRHQTVYDNIRQREQSAMEYYTTAIESCDPSEIFSEEIMETCRKTLAALPAETRQIYVRSRIEGLTHKEIAEAMSISVKKVDRCIMKAMKELKAALGEYADIIVVLISGSLLS